MSVYTQDICEDGEAILKDGVMMTVEEILHELRFAQIGRIACDNPDLTGRFIIDAIQATEEMESGDVEEYIRGWRCS